MVFSSDGKKIIVTFSHHYSGLAPTSKGGHDRWVSKFAFEIVEDARGDRTRGLPETLMVFTSRVLPSAPGCRHA